MKLIFLYFLFSFNLVYSQIANIESIRTNDTSKYTGFISFSFENSYNIKSSNELGGSFHFQFLNKKTRVFLINDFDYLKTNNELIKNYNLQHIRYNYHLSKRIVFETFLQGQHNQALDLNYRINYGLGLRFKIIQSNSFKTYLGTLLMREENILKKTNYYKNGTLTDLYMTTYIKFNEKISGTNIFYFQSFIDKDFNHRFLDELELSFIVSKKITIVETFSIIYSKYHPCNIDNCIYNQKTSFKYNL